MIALHKVAAPRLDRTAKAADEVAAYERIDSTHAKARRLIERGRFARNDDGGIAITVPVSGMQNHVMQMLNEEARNAIQQQEKGDESQMKEKSEFSLIWVSVASGYSDDVVDVARAAGARGGTVMKGRRRNSEHASQYFGISLQEEQEFVMIVVPREKKCEIMSAITTSCGLKTPAHGMVISLPVDDVMGLEQ